MSLDSFLNLIFDPLTLVLATDKKVKYEVKQKQSQA